MLSGVRASIVVVLVACGLTVACRPRSFVLEDAGPATLAVADLTAPKKPPPLHAARLATPMLPDLPALAAHEAPAPAPAAASLNDSPCRAVWTGSQTASLACARSLLFGGAQAAT